MLLIVIFELFIRISMCYSFTNVDSDIIFVSNRVKTLDSPVFAAGNRPSYTINFGFTFQFTPLFLMSTVSIHYDSTTQSKGQIRIPESVSTNLVSSNFNIYVMSTQIFFLQVNYLAVIWDPSSFMSFPNVIAYPQNNVVTSNIDMSTLTQFGTNTHFGCFFSQLDGAILYSPFTLKIQCKVKNLNTLDVTIILPGTVDNSIAIGINHFTRKVLISAMVIKNDGSMKITAGTLQAYNSIKSPTLILNNHFPQSLLYIGLTGFSTPNWNFNIRLDPFKLQIISLSPFHQIIYNFIFVEQLEDLTGSSLQIMKTHVFGSWIVFTYNFMNLSEVKLNQFEINATWLAGIIIQQHIPQQIDHAAVFVASPIITNTIQFICHLTKGWRKYKNITYAKIIIIERQSVNVFDRKISILIKNAKNTLLQNFEYPSNFNNVSVTQSGDDSIVEIYYNDTSVLGQNVLVYYDPLTEQHGQMKFVVPVINSIQTSIQNTRIIIKLNWFGTNFNQTQTQFTIHGQCVQNYTMFLILQTITFQQDYIISKDPIKQTFQIHYKSNILVYSEFQMIFKLVTLQYIRVFTDKNVSQLIFINIKNPQRYQVNYITSNISSISTESLVPLNNQTLQITIYYSQIYNNEKFLLTIRQLSNSFSIVVDNVKIIHRYSHFTAIQYQNKITIYFKNIELCSNSTLPLFRLNITSIIIHSVIVSSDSLNIIVFASFNESIVDKRLDIYYNDNPETIFEHISSLSLTYDFPLYYCIDQFQQKTQLYRSYSKSLQYIYLIIFVYAVICHNKLLAVEMIFLIQLSYYLMIPIGIFCPPFIGIDGMKYISGINPLFQTNQKNISYNFLIFGFQSDFLSNVNIMLISIIICPILSLILNLIGNKSSSFKIKPRLLKYAKSFLLQVLYTFLFFNSFNIYIGFGISIQNFKQNSILSFILSIISATLLPAFNALKIFFNKHFIQFREQFNVTQRIGQLSQKTSVKVRQFYPLILSFEFIAIPLIVSINSLLNYSLYLVISITTLVFIYVLVSTPYSHKIDNIRLIAHRCLITIICSINIVFKLKMNEHAPIDNFLYQIPLIIFIFLTVGIVIDGIWIILQSIKWFKKKGLIDHKMKLQTTCSLKKPAPFTKDVGVYYPKLQYGQYKRQNMINRKKKINNKDKLDQQQNLIEYYQSNMQ